MSQEKCPRCGAVENKHYRDDGSKWIRMDYECGSAGDGDMQMFSTPVCRERASARKALQAAARRCHATEMKYEEISSNHDEHSQVGAYWRGQAAGARDCMNGIGDLIERLEREGLSALELAKEGE